MHPDSSIPFCLANSWRALQLHMQGQQQSLKQQEMQIVAQHKLLSSSTPQTDKPDFPKVDPQMQELQQENWQQHSAPQSVYSVVDGVFAC